MGPKHDGQAHRERLSQMLTEADKKSDDSGIDEGGNVNKYGDAIELLGE